MTIGEDEMKFGVRFIVRLTIVYLIVFNCIFAHAAKDPLRDLSKRLRVEECDNSVPLDYPIACAAIDSQGNVAIRSGSSHDSYNYVLSIYSNTGEYLYGYGINLSTQRGRGILFFDEADVLCYSITYSSDDSPTQDVQLRFERSSALYSSIPTGDEDVYACGSVEYSNNNVPIFTSNRSPYSMARCTAYTFAIRDSRTDEIRVIYNYSDQYPIVRERRQKKGLLALAICIPFTILLGFLLSHCKENMDG